MANPTPDFLRIIRVLLEHDVDFIIVGGVCAVLQGVPVTTADLDIVHRRSEENVTKLLAALDALAAQSRLDSRGLTFHVATSLQDTSSMSGGGKRA